MDPWKCYVIDVCLANELASQLNWSRFRPPDGRPRLTGYAKVNREEIAWKAFLSKTYFNAARRAVQHCPLPTMLDKGYFIG